MGRKVTWKLKSDVVELGCVMRLSYEQPISEKCQLTGVFLMNL